jgi:hypothetical protein
MRLPLSSKSDTASKSRDYDPNLVRLQSTGEINRRIIFRAHREQAEWRKSKQSFKSVFPIANNFLFASTAQNLTRLLSQKPSHKFSNNESSHKSCREWPLLFRWFPDTTRATNHFYHASYVPLVRLEVLGEGGSGRQRTGRQESIVGLGLGLVALCEFHFLKIP